MSLLSTKSAARNTAFELDYEHPLSNGLVFAGLGRNPGSLRFLDSSLKGNHGTLTNMDPATDWVWSPELNRYVLDFDGSNDVVSTPLTVQLYSSGTISWWQYSRRQRTDATSDSSWGQNTGANPYFDAQRYAPDRKWYVGSYNSAEYRVVVATSDTNWPYLMWRAYAFTWTPTYSTFFCDGVQIGQNSGTTTIGTPGGTIQIGKQGAGVGAWLNGAIADFTLWDRTLSQSEIQLLASRDPFYNGWIVPELSSKRYYIFGSTQTPALTPKQVVRKQSPLNTGMVESSTVVRAWKEYGRQYAKYPSLWDGSLAFASGPLEPEGATLRDYSGRTAGATWSVGAGDVPKYVQGSVRGQSFWAGKYDGTNDHLRTSVTSINTTSFSVVAWSSVLSVGATQMIVQKSYQGGSYIGTFELKVHPVGIIAASVRTSESPYSLSAYTAGKVVASVPFFAGIIWTGSNLSVILNNEVVTVSGAGKTVIQEAWYLHYGCWSNTNPTQPPITGEKDYLSGYIGPSNLYNRVLTTNEIAILAQHPLAAYETVRPKYYIFDTTTTPQTYYYGNTIIQSSKNRGKRSNWKTIFGSSIVT